MVALNFNAGAVEPTLALEPIPTGHYPAVITASEMKPTKNGQGQYLQLEITVQGGQHNGRKVFDRLNLVNNNPTAVEIAYRTLSAICHVTGVIQCQDSAQLHGRPFTVVVVKKKRDDDPSQDTNEVRGYKDAYGNDPGFQGQVAQPQAQPGWAAPGGPSQTPQGTPGNAPAMQQHTQPPQYQAPPPNTNGNGAAPPPPPAETVASAPTTGSHPDGKAPPPWVKQ